MSCLPHERNVAALHDRSIVREADMKIKLPVAWFALLAMIAGAGHLASAQDEATKTTHQKVRTVTGCLEKTKDANEYQLTTKDGATWEIDSDAVKIAPHVGHTVSVTGVVSNATLHGLKEDTKTEAREHGIGKNSTEHGHMTVTGLKMVSESCSRGRSGQ